jgi:hypothetical protein
MEQLETRPTAEALGGMIDMMFATRLREGSERRPTATLSWEANYLRTDVDRDQLDGTTSAVLTFDGSYTAAELTNIVSTVSMSIGIDDDDLEFSFTDNQFSLAWTMNRVWNGRKARAA